MCSSPWVVQAQTPSVLTSNTGLTVLADDELHDNAGVGNYLPLLRHNKVAQRFTTGTDTNGYTLTSVGINFKNIADTSTAGADLDVTIRLLRTSGRLIGHPGNTVCTLNDPATFTSSGVQTFTVPSSCPNLDHNPAGGNSGHYYLHISRLTGTSGIQLHRTATVDRAHSGAWAVINNALFGSFLGTTSYKDRPFQYMIEITGHRVGGI